MAFSFQPKVVTDGMIFCVDAANTKSYLGSGTNVTNLGTTVSTASLVNGVVYNSSQGGAFFFDGTNDFISCGDVNFRIPSSSFSIEVVFSHDGTNKTNMPIFMKRNSNAPFNEWSLSVNNGNPYAGGTGTVLLSFLRPDESLNSGPPDPKDRTMTYTMPSAGIYHAILTNTPTTGSLYVNGILQSIGTSSQSQDNFLVSNADMRIGNNNATSYFTGSVYVARVYNRALSSTEVLQNYNALCTRFNREQRDVDAVAFITAANIFDANQQNAVNTLVIDLKRAGVWNKMVAIYPFVGGTASTHRFNLKDPRDLDAAFRLQFNGGWVHSSTGADPNGTNAYADTYLIPFSALKVNNLHYSLYIRENVIGVTGMCDIGSAQTGFTGERDIYFLALNQSGNGTEYRINQFGLDGFLNNDSRGYYIVSRTGLNAVKGYKNSVLRANNQFRLGYQLNNLKLYLSQYNSNTGGIQPSSRELAFVTIGDGLNDMESFALSDIVQKYQTTLGRQV